MSFPQAELRASWAPLLVDFPALQSAARQARGEHGMRLGFSGCDLAVGFSYQVTWNLTGAALSGSMLIGGRVVDVISISCCSFLLEQKHV